MLWPTRNTGFSAERASSAADHRSFKNRNAEINYNDMTGRVKRLRSDFLFWTGKISKQKHNKILLLFSFTKGQRKWVGSAGVLAISSSQCQHLQNRYVHFKQNAQDLFSHLHGTNQLNCFLAMHGPKMSTHCSVMMTAWPQTKKKKKRSQVLPCAHIQQQIKNCHISRNSTNSMI